MRIWRGLNSLRGLVRWPLKVGVFAIVTGLVLYPKLWLLPTWLERLGDLNSLVDPEHVELASLEAEVRAELSDPHADRETLEAVQRVVCRRIPYAWDWEVWGVAEYLPTVAEVFEQGREDCDGRAVVAASLLRRMGHDAWLVSDLLHMWVATPEGETMSPTGAEKTFVGTQTGTATRVSLGAVRNLGRGLSYGVAVFPLSRELIILATLCVLTMQPWSSGWRRVAGCLLLWIALDTLRGAGQQVILPGQTGAVARAGLGVALAVGGSLVLAVRVGGPPRRWHAKRPEWSAGGDAARSGSRGSVGRQLPRLDGTSGWIPRMARTGTAGAARRVSHSGSCHPAYAPGTRSRRLRARAD
jgi:hypothetical protein